MSFAWIIDVDHVADAAAPTGTNANAPGVMGPKQAPGWMTDALQKQAIVLGVKTYHFKMYDDDGELYYAGRMITDEGESTEAVFSPLDNFGGPNAGATEIRYPGHANMDPC